MFPFLGSIYHFSIYLVFVFTRKFIQLQFNVIFWWNLKKSKLQNCPIWCRVYLGYMKLSTNYLCFWKRFLEVYKFWFPCHIELFLNLSISDTFQKHTNRECNVWWHCGCKCAWHVWPFDLESINWLQVRVLFLLPRSISCQVWWRQLLTGERIGRSYIRRAEKVEKVTRCQRYSTL